MKKLYKSRTDRKVCGVCAGVAEYFGFDATLARIGWVVLSLCGPGVLAYIICAIIMPEDPGLIEE